MYAPLQLADPIVAGSATANLFANIARETRARSASSPSKHTATLLEADDIADEDEGANDVRKVDEVVMREQLQLWHSARQARAVEEAESGLGPRTVSLVAGRGRRMSSSFGGGVQRTRAMSMAPQGSQQQQARYYCRSTQGGYAHPHDTASCCWPRTRGNRGQCGHRYKQGLLRQESTRYGSE